MRRRCKKSRTRPAGNIIARTTRKSSGRFTRKLTSWKRRKPSSTNTRNTRNCSRGSCHADWRCCCSKSCWDKLHFGGCHEIYDLRFTIYDLKMRFEYPQILWLLLVLPLALAMFFWWRERSRQKLLAQFIEARLLSQLTVGVSPTRRKLRFGILILAVALLIIALARPQQIGRASC